jgi:hypothetical protein
MVCGCFRGGCLDLKHGPHRDQFVGNHDDVTGPRRPQQLDGRWQCRVLDRQAQNGLAWIRAGRLLLPPEDASGATGGRDRTGGTTTQFVDWSLPAWGIGFDVLRLRLPLLRDDQFIHGRVQPYLAAGPAVFITYAGQNTFVQPGGQRSTDASVGAKVDAGVTVMITKRIGAFAQYRFTHFTTELQYQNTSPALATERFKTTYDTHHAIAGLSLRF